MIIHGDCLEVLKTLNADSVDALVTDPPAGIGFMGKEWDHHKGGRLQWIAWMAQVMRECYRVMKPGAHGLVWALPRTSHWTATALEEAGFEVRDVITHLQGQGFPKSLSVNKALEKDGKVCTCERQAQNGDGSNLRGVRAPIHAKNTKTDLKTQDMQLQVQRCNEALESGVCCSPTDDCTKHEGSQGDTSIWHCQSVMEGRSHVQEEQGELHRAEICQMPEGISTNVSSRWLCDGASSSDGHASKTTAESDRSGSPQRSQHTKQPAKQPRAIPKQSGTQTCGSCGKATIPEGLGTALKPASEHWVLIRKPISEKTVAANVLRWSTGALNIDGCRIETQDKLSGSGGAMYTAQGQNVRPYQKYFVAPGVNQSPLGRFPANLVLSHSPHCTDTQCDIECAIAMLDAQSGSLHSSGIYQNNGIGTGKGSTYLSQKSTASMYTDRGGASRFFYCAKISPSERGEDNKHPCVKSQKLMRYLCRLVTPPAGVILDPFLGSGSTGLAAKSEGFGFIGIEKEAEYVRIAEARIQRK